MIDSLRGVIAFKSPTYIIVDVHGMGFGINIPLSTYSRLKDINSAILIHTRVYIREELVQIFGFHTAEEKELFEIMIGVSGVGPRMALGILSALSVKQFSDTIAAGDISALTAVPGIGKKKAERLMLELKDKIITPETAKSGRGAATGAGMAEKFSEAAAALGSLGSSPGEAIKAVRSAAGVLPEDAPLEDIVREALKHL